MPQAVRKLFQPPALRNGTGYFGRNGEARMQVARHRQAKDEEIIQSSAFGAQVPPICRSGKPFECELKVEDQAEAFVAMASGMKAKKEQLIFRGKLPATFPLEDCRARPPQCAFRIKIEGQWVLNVVV